MGIRVGKLPAVEEAVFVWIIWITGITFAISVEVLLPGRLPGEDLNPPRTSRFHGLRSGVGMWWSKGRMGMNQHSDTPISMDGVPGQ